MAAAAACYYDSDAAAIMPLADGFGFDSESENLPAEAAEAADDAATRTWAYWADRAARSVR